MELIGQIIISYQLLFISRYLVLVLVCNYVSLLLDGTIMLFCKELEWFPLGLLEYLII